MSEDNKDKMHRVSITINSDDYAALQKLADIGYMNANKPTTVASGILTRYLWENLEEIVKQHNARKELLK